MSRAGPHAAVRWLARPFAPGWARWFEPSLVRRLLWTQGLLLLGVWLMVLAYLLHHSMGSHSELAQDARYEMVLAVADSLAAQPTLLARSLQGIDRFQRTAEDIEDDPALRIGMLLRQGERVLFASPGLPPTLHNRAPGALEEVSAGGMVWRARTVVSPGSGLALTLAKPAGGINVVVSRSSWSLLLSPLVISLPFLALPAWLSLRLALRPWSRLAHELASRGPSDLRPLAFQPRHRELRPLAANIDALLARVRDSARREREFIADAAHELRTPLAALRVHAEALEDEPAPSLRRELVDGMRRSAERAARIASQLLSLMRAEAVHPEGRAPLDPGALAQDRLAALAGLASARGVELVLQAPAGAVLSAEREGLASLIDNLVENAIKHSPPGATVQVRIASEAQAIVLSVADEGPGIPLALQQRVFDRFYRAPDQAHSGSGLGLAIVKSVAERHGAVISLAARPAGAGLLVSVRFPHDAP